MEVFIKDPLANLDYSQDWRDASKPWLQVGENIQSYVLNVPAGLTQGSDSESNGKVTVWLSGGTEDTLYQVEMKITTDLGRTDERTMLIRVEKRYTKIFLKDPESELDFAEDWNDWLGSGETISSHTVTVDSGITKESDPESGGVVTVNLSGGTAGNVYDVVMEVTTNQGRTDARRFKISVEER